MSDGEELKSIQVIQEYLHNQKRGKYGSNGEFVEQFVEQNVRVRVRVRVRTVTLI